MTDPLHRARALLRDADRVLVLTGAGVSQESGVPTFRGAEGLWRSFRPEELATPGAFARDPRTVWAWYRWRRRRIAPCGPNAAHLAIARLAARRPGVTVVTQNVDGLHELAAAAVAREAGATRPAHPAPPPLALHGSLYGSRCTRCDHREVEPRATHGSGAEPDDAAIAALELPCCPRCGAPLRPDVVWFGESLDPGILEAAWSAAERAAVCLVVGTSGVVQPAASLAAVTRERGGAVIEVNPEPTPLTPLATISLRSGAVAALPALLDPDTAPVGAEPSDAG